MIQGTGSDVGKSLLVAGLCRALTNRGHKVLPFKPQNMSNHAAVTDCGGGEIGRAQWLQARACRAPTSVHMNPVLLKPESDGVSQIVVQGKRLGKSHAREYRARKGQLLAAARESFFTLQEQADFIIIEGAGSPAEINLRKGDFANMGFAQPFDIPVILAADIDRGGVIASVVGTHAVLDAADRACIKGFLINKFRGDVSLFASGAHDIAARTGWTHFGTVPFLDDITHLPKEDGYSLRNHHETKNETAAITIAVLMLPHISNADDVDPLRAEADVEVQFVAAGQVIPLDADMVIVPGTKSTISDLAYVRAQGWDVDLQAYVRRGGTVLGICGGYQMLGTELHDPQGMDGAAGSVDGLGLLDIQTHFSTEKQLEQWQGVCPQSGAEVRGYHMHMGMTAGGDCARAMFDDGDSASHENGHVMGCYIHGLFASDAYRHAFLSRLKTREKSSVYYDALIDAELDVLAAHMERVCDVDAMVALAKTVPEDLLKQAG